MLTISVLLLREEQYHYLALKCSQLCARIRCIIMLSTPDVSKAYPQFYLCNCCRFILKQCSYASSIVPSFNVTFLVQTGGAKMKRTAYELAVECLQVNYYGTKRTTEALLPLLQLSDSPRIVNVSSSMGALSVLSYFSC